MESQNVLYIFAEGIIYLTMLGLAIYTLVLGYHWFSYGASRKTSMSAFVIFIAGSALLVLGLVMSYNFF